MTAGSPAPSVEGVEHVAVDALVRLPDAPEVRSILGMRVDATSYEDAAERICAWASAADSRYVCVAAVNNAIQAHDHADFRRDMNGADLVTPDGMPLVWGLRLLGVDNASRVYGPHLTHVVCRRAAEEGIPVGFYGGTTEVLDALTQNLRRRYPALNVAYRHSPPFRTPTADETEATRREIDRSGTRILFVGIGAPKQEAWMARHRGSVSAVMIGVGAAFDFLADKKRQAPGWIQGSGLEWLFRLVHEPRRLWKRYLIGNPRFVVLFAGQLIREGGRARSTARQSRRA
jgi:N-acetylglucosaminyldiphosphoundecaprenol N-acetyl-beta-D-mannosaminyltransferase